MHDISGSELLRVQIGQPRRMERFWGPKTQLNTAIKSITGAVEAELYNDKVFGNYIDKMKR
jgi:hypothetical protein